MDKDGSATHRRHRPGPGAPPMGVGPAHLKAASEMAELQRSRSVGGLLQKGDPPSCIKKLCKELESEDPGKDVRSEAEDASCQASLEDKQDRGQDARGQALEDANVEEASTRHEQLAGGEGADECAPEDEEAALPRLSHARHPCVSDFPPQKPPVFVEIDLGDLAEEVVTCITKEEKRPQRDMGDVSEDECPEPGAVAPDTLLSRLEGPSGTSLELRKASLAAVGAAEALGGRSAAASRFLSGEQHGPQAIEFTQNHLLALWVSAAGVPPQPQPLPRKPGTRPHVARQQKPSISIRMV
ncbi:hypothetical protein E5288_WYG011563 [Bos mutus]|uniref:Uncharacterized protein n=1 Tax=Bos mutus TaxID=72004 RepID=A0A6B0RI84_9CETA|nr:hypothetical protein [Bos mutus]